MSKGRGETDRRGKLESDPFDVEQRRSGEVVVSRGGRPVTTIRGAAAEKLVKALEKAEDERARQLVLAKATGHYKH